MKEVNMGRAPKRRLTYSMNCFTLPGTHFYSGSHIVVFCGVCAVV